MQERLNYDYDSGWIDGDYLCRWLERLNDIGMKVLEEYAGDRATNFLFDYLLKFENTTVSIDVIESRYKQFKMERVA